MKKNRAAKYISLSVCLLLAILFVAKFGGRSILRLYIEMGVGSCRKIPILCMAPEEGIISSDINKEYCAQLIPYKFPKMEIATPRGFAVVKETIKKVYYKKQRSQYARAVIYLTYQPPDFFVNLFPQLKKQGRFDNYEFIKRTMSAQLKDINNLTDCFFVIMKGIFIPDLGRQENARMVEFSLADKRGFINYNLGGPNNYFDSNVIDKQGNYFKIYIKDREARLALDKVLAIISTAKTLN